jgi:hypothetical protein
MFRFRNKNPIFAHASKNDLLYSRHFVPGLI